MIPHTCYVIIVSNDNVSTRNVVLNPKHNESFYDALFETLPDLKNKLLFMVNASQYLNFHPEITNPNDIDYANRFIHLEKALVENKILSSKALENIKAEPPDTRRGDHYNFLCILFDCKETALKALESFDNDHGGYCLELYDGGKLIARSSMINTSVAIVSGDTVEIKEITTRKGKSFFDCIPKLKTGAFFKIDIETHPELIWPNTPSMWTYCNRINKALVSIGILSQKALDALCLSSKNSYDLYVRYDSEKEALDAYTAVMSHNHKKRLDKNIAYIVDIYIYSNGKIIQEFD